MERRDIIVTLCEHDTATGEWRADGTAERYGASVPWSAWRGDTETRWAVQIPASSQAHPFTEDDQLLVLEGTPLSQDVNTTLGRPADSA